MFRFWSHLLAVDFLNDPVHFIEIKALALFLYVNGLRKAL